MTRVPAALAAALLGLGAVACSAGPSPGAGPEAAQIGPEAAREARGTEDGDRAAGGAFAYVGNQADATIAVIDMEANEVVATVDLVELGFTPQAKPHDVAVEPDGSHWYVTLIGDGKVLKFDRENRLVGQVDTEVPGLLALHPNADLLYVGRSMSAVDPPSSIGIVRRSDMTLLHEVDVFIPRPHALLVDARGEWVYVASLAQNRIALVSRDGERVELVSYAQGDPVHSLVQFAASPDGHTVVAGGELSGKLLVFDSSDPAALTLVETVDVPAGPWHPEFTADGAYVWFGNQGADAVTVVDAATWQVDAVIEGRGLAMPHGIAIRPDGEYVYVSNRNLNGDYRPETLAEAGREGAVGGGEAVGQDAPQTAREGMEGMDMGGESEFPGTVVVIDADERTIEKVIEIGAAPSGMGAPAGAAASSP